MIKVIGCMFIIASSSCMGYMLGAKYSMRVKELKFIKMSLQMLETEIAYSNTPLAEAFDSVQKRSSGTIRELFKAMSQNLYKRVYSTVGEAFEMAISKTKEKMSLTIEDMDILKSFGHTMGSSDVEGQVKSFKMVIKQLDGQELKAEESRNKNERMYKNLGVLSGLAIVILLL